jgi:hypothetical protein
VHHLWRNESVRQPLHLRYVRRRGHVQGGHGEGAAIIGIATGDASIEAAMKNGGIKKVHHVDTQVKNILGIYAEYITIVYGE